MNVGASATDQDDAVLIVTNNYFEKLLLNH